MNRIRSKTKLLRNIVSYSYLSILSVMAVFPLFWILSSSIKSKGEITGNPTALLPEKYHLNFIVLL